jgi:hypothetical protein
MGLRTVLGLRKKKHKQSASEAGAKPIWDRADPLHWHLKESFLQDWSKRAEKAVEFLKPEERTVVEIGCGANQALRSLIGNRIYLPADLHQWTPDTEVCDLNKGQYPAALAKADVCFLLGVLEYLDDVPVVMRTLGTRVPSIIISYTTRDHHPKQVAARTNGFSRIELLTIMSDAGLIVERECLTDWFKQTIWRVSRRS